jgi:chemotaxis protein MotB
MAARGGRRRRKVDESEHADERWLLTYADMITLLMALFMVLFAMADVDSRKFEGLRDSLSNAFAPTLLPGGDSIAVHGGPAAVAPPVPAGVPGATNTAAQTENEELQRLKQRVDEYAREHGLDSKIAARVERRGLVITILTDKLLFDSGGAALRPEGTDLLRGIGPLLRHEDKHRVIVEGYTDTDPIRGSMYPSNWELSTARSSTVVRALMQAQVRPTRLTASGRADLDPIASNATAAGRSRNRRVQIVLPRQDASPTSDAAAPKVGFTAPAFAPQELSTP